jgi:hypothetical protein
MAGHIPSDMVSGASFNWLTLRLLPFQSGLGEYVEAGGTGMLMRQPLLRDGCLAGLWNLQRGSGW